MSSLLFLTHRFYEYIYVVAISSFKFIFAGPAAAASGFNFWETALSLAIGGLAGFFIFYFFSAQLILFFNRIFPPRPRVPKSGWMKRYRRRIALKKFGFPLLLVVGPLLLSIPVTAFIVRRWLRNNKHIFVYFCISIVSWAFVFGIVSRFIVVK